MPLTDLLLANVHRTGNKIGSFAVGSNVLNLKRQQSDHSKRDTKNKK